MSAIRPMNRYKRAKGGFDQQGRCIIACRFDEEMFEQILTLAIAQNIAFSEQVRILVRAELNRRAAARQTA